MAFQLSDIANKVRRRIRDTNYSSQETIDYINDTQNDIFNEYRLPFMETIQEYTLTIGETDITNSAGLPANYVGAIDLILTGSEGDRVVEYLDVRSIDRLTTESENDNAPRYWYFYDEKIQVYPAPDKAYTVKLRYYKKPTALSADADVPEIPSEFEEILVSGAAYRILQVKDNYDQASIHQNKYDELLLKLVVRYSQPQTGKPLTMRINRRHVGKTNY